MAIPANISELMPFLTDAELKQLEFLTAEKERFAKMSDEEARRIEYRTSLERDFPSFIRAAWPIIRPGLALSWSWHYDLISEWLTLVWQRKCRRLVINLPPRTLKSLMVTVLFPAWVWTKEPTHNFACSSYSAELSTEHSVIRRTLIESDWFRGLWGDRIWLASDQNQKTKYKNNHEAQMIATSVGGTATGLGGDTLILDDGLNPKQAASEAERKTACEWFDNTWRSRLNDQATGALIVLEQRTAELDVSGYVLQNNAGEWVHLNIPLEAEPVKQANGTIGPERWVFPISGKVYEREPGAVLQPDRFPPEVVAGLKKLRLVWSGQYQGHPSPLEGNMIKRAEVRYYGGTDPITGVVDPPLPETFDSVVISADCTFKDLSTSDYVAVGAVGVKGPNRYIINVVNKHLDEPGTEAAILRMRAESGGRAVLVEDKANGPAVIKKLKQKIPGVIEVNPQGGKVARMFAVCGEWQSGNWYVDRNAAWCEPFVEQITKFPGAAHDDMADMMTQAGIWLQAHNYAYGLLAYAGQQVAEAKKQQEALMENSKVIKPDSGVQSIVCINENCKSHSVVRIGNLYRCNSCQTTWPAVTTPELDSKILGRNGLASQMRK
jgi:predicted phage terminase large subunit-like protein